MGRGRGGRRRKKKEDQINGQSRKRFQSVPEQKHTKYQGLLGGHR